MIDETQSHRLIKRLDVIEKDPSERVAPDKQSRHDAITNWGPPPKRQRIGDYLMCSSIAPKKTDWTKTAKSGIWYRYRIENRVSTRKKNCSCLATTY